jgi:hypothetical protein
VVHLVREKLGVLIRAISGAFIDQVNYADFEVVLSCAQHWRPVVHLIRGVGWT